MKILLASLFLSVPLLQARANPSSAIVETCLHAVSASSAVQYTPIEVGAFEVTDDEDLGKITTTFRHGKDTIGTWELKKTQKFGLIFNGRETQLDRVIRLNKQNVPAEFNPYEAIWGIARDSKRSYICATFNFDGLGKSGSFQNVRGLYLIERNKKVKFPFYTMGNIVAGKN
jgi:hypothetical protein